MSPEPIRVLLLEDDPDDAFLLRDVLEGTAPGQFAIEHVTRLAEAIERLSPSPPDAVLSDLNVLDSQGLDTLLGIRSARSDVPIVVLTGVDDEAVAVRAVQEGAQDYLTKAHLDGPVLVRSLRYAIERQKVSHYRAVLLERERFDTAIAHMSDGIVVTDGDWRITTANRAACLLLNLLPDQCTGRPLDEVLSGFQLSTPLTDLRSSSDRAQAFDIARPDTEPPLFLDARLTRLFDGDRPLSLVLALRDVTEERREQELRATFFMMVSHKLRTPLTVLIACLDLCKRLPPDKAAGQLAEVLGVCDLEVQRLGHIVQQLLEFKALGTRELQPGSETADIAAVLWASSQAVRLRHRDRDVSVTTTIAPSASHAACGPEHLSLVLDKLLDNAVKFCDKEAVEVAVRVEPAESGRLRFTVRDNGSGIPHEYFDRIFEPFVQVEDLPTGQVSGIGVGLSMARQVVGAFGGTISVQSRLGEGSEFTFTMPAWHPDTAAPFVLGLG